MTKRSQMLLSKIKLTPAKRQQEPILANLLQLYLHDFSEFIDLDIGPNGRFAYPHLALYWSEPGRHPFLVRVDGKLAGLVLVKKALDTSGSETVWDMAEFFVMRQYRGHGIGTRVAHELWKLFPGPWQIRVMQSNVSARRFWKHAISKFIREPIHPARFEKDEGWLVFSFKSERPP